MLDIQTRPDQPESLAGDAIVHFLFEGAAPLPPSLAELDGRLDGTLAELVSTGEAKGKLHEVHVIPTLRRTAARRVLLLGAGKPDELTAEIVERLFGQAAREAGRRGWATVIAGSTTVPAGNLPVEACIRAAATGAIVGTARGDLYKTHDRPEEKLERLIFAGPGGQSGWAPAVKAGRAVGEGVNFARELVFQPPDDMTPAILADRAAVLAEQHGFEATILDKRALEELGAHALLAVARGSAQEPRLIRLSYGRFPDKPVLGLVGKGLTFDSGGLCLKPADSMADMKIDMAGAAAVLGAMRALGEIRPEVNVVAVCPASENMTGPAAYKPGDVVRTLGGKTIEILNTDAEGRVILADGLAYAQQSGATHLVDLATLTGACVVALGNVCTGVMGGPQEWIDRVLAAARAAGEKMWQLPLFDEYKEQIKSDIADVENSGGRPAGAQTGALLLKEFVGEGTAWAHLDIAGTAWSTADSKFRVKGATGVGVRTLVQLVESMAAGS